MAAEIGSRRAGGCALQGHGPRVAQRREPALTEWAECAGPSITTALEAAAEGDGMERRRIVEARDHLERAEKVLAGLTGDTARWAREAVRSVVELLEHVEAS